MRDMKQLIIDTDRSELVSSTSPSLQRSFPAACTLTKHFGMQTPLHSKRDGIAVGLLRLCQHSLTSPCPYLRSLGINDLPMPQSPRPRGRHHDHAQTHTLVRQNSAPTRPFPSRGASEARNRNAPLQQRQTGHLQPYLKSS